MKRFAVCTIVVAAAFVALWLLGARSHGESQAGLSGAELGATTEPVTASPPGGRALSEDNRLPIDGDEVVGDDFLRVVGRLRSASGRYSGAVLVSLTPVVRHPVPIQVISEADGTFEATVPWAHPLDGEAAPKKVEVIVGVRAPGYLPAVKLYEASIADGDESGNEIRVDLVLRPAARAISGVVRLPEGLQRRKEDVSVAVFELGGTGIPRMSPENVTRCGSAGEFQLSIGEGEANRVVVATADGLRPTTMPVDLNASGPLSIDLTTGEQVSGVIGFSTGGSTTVNARLLFGSDLHGSAWKRLVWLDGQFESGVVQSTAKGDGAFLITGLAPAEYRIRINLVAGTITFVESSLDVIAPSEGVVLGLGCAKAIVQVSAAGAALVNASVEFSTNEPIPGTPITKERLKSQTTDSSGQVVAILDSAVDYHLDVSLSRHSSHIEELAPLGVGETREIQVELRTQQQPSKLEIILSSAEDNPDLIYVSLLPVGTSSGGGRVERTIRAASGRVVLENLLPGEYLLFASPSRGSFDGNYLLDTRASVTLSPGDTDILDLQLNAGGRFRLDSGALGDEGDTLALVLRDGAGITLPVYYRSRSIRELPNGGHTAVIERAYGSVSAGVEVEAFPNLAPGAYSLTVVGEGGAETTRHFNIVAREVVTVR